MIPKALVLDFDGVVLDSTRVKSSAMAALFAHERPEHVAAIVALHERLGGVDRYRKFDMIHADILCRPLSPEWRAELGRRFSDLVFQQVLECPFIAGAHEALEECRSHGLPVFVASGTPEDELKTIVERRGLQPFFREVHGSPRGKPEILADIMERYGYCPNDLIFVGDAVTDEAAALERAVPFIGVVTNLLDNPFAPTVLIVPDLTDLAGAMARLPNESNEFAS
ncbi:MAG: HAD hydrolase-like protein [Magnetospirillum sp.]|nr:HAD hydrolase-like protein [Magnetospirillum sp.]